MRSWISNLVVNSLALTLCLIVTTTKSPSAYAGLAFQYTGTIFDVDDPFGVFANAAVSIGDSVSGEIAYGEPLAPGLNLGYGAFYTFAVGPGGDSRMTARLNSLNLEARQTLSVGVYNPADFGSSGIDFQFNDSDVGLLSTANLAPGFRLANFITYVSLFSASRADTSSFPNLPSTLLDLSQYDDPNTIGFFSVNIFNANGAYVASPSMAFNFTSLQAVPEPSSISACLLGLGLLLAKRRLGATKRV